MKKKSIKKLQLSMETVRHMDLSGVNGGLTTFWSCPEDPETKAFTNCDFCPYGPSDETAYWGTCRDLDYTY